MTSTEPMILVKKADGTTARVPLSSLRKQTTDDRRQTTDSTKAVKSDIPKTTEIAEQLTNNNELVVNKEHGVPVQEISPITNLQSSVLQSASPTKETSPQELKAVKTVPNKNTRPKKQPLPVPATPHELSTASPVDDFFVDFAKSHIWTQTDHISPLAEQTPIMPTADGTGMATIPAHRFEDVQHVVNALPFDTPRELDSRFHALIQSRIKDIRSDTQVQDYAMRPLEHGGLALSAEQAQTLINTIHTVLSVKKTEGIPHTQKTMLHTRRPLPGGIPTERMTRPNHLVFPFSAQSSARSQTVSFRDIHPPTKQDLALGPVDEIATMTLLDFRRLATEPQQAVDILKEKIDTLRKESYLEYLRAQDAWQRSPLYLTYLAHLEQSLNEGRSLKDMLDGDMTAEDISVMASFSEWLRY